MRLTFQGKTCPDQSGGRCLPEEPSGYRVQEASRFPRTKGKGPDDSVAFLSGQLPIPEKAHGYRDKLFSLPETLSLLHRSIHRCNHLKPRGPATPVSRIYHMRHKTRAFQ